MQDLDVASSKTLCRVLCPHVFGCGTLETTNEPRLQERNGASPWSGIQESNSAGPLMWHEIRRLIDSS